jgi:hypothetical protein
MDPTECVCVGPSVCVCMVVRARHHHRTCTFRNQASHLSSSVCIFRQPAQHSAPVCASPHSGRVLSPGRQPSAPGQPGRHQNIDEMMWWSSQPDGSQPTHALSGTPWTPLLVASGSDLQESTSSSTDTGSGSCRAHSCATVTTMLTMQQVVGPRHAGDSVVLLEGGPLLPAACCWCGASSCPAPAGLNPQSDPACLAMAHTLARMRGGGLPTYSSTTYRLEWS